MPSCALGAHAALSLLLHGNGDFPWRPECAEEVEIIDALFGTIGDLQPRRAAGAAGVHLGRGGARGRQGQLVARLADDAAPGAAAPAGPARARAPALAGTRSCDGAAGGGAWAGQLVACLADDAAPGAAAPAGPARARAPALAGTRSCDGVTGGGAWAGGVRPRRGILGRVILGRVPRPSQKHGRRRRRPGAGHLVGRGLPRRAAESTAAQQRATAGCGLLPAGRALRARPPALPALPHQPRERRGDRASDPVLALRISSVAPRPLAGTVCKLGGLGRRNLRTASPPGAGKHWLVACAVRDDLRGLPLPRGLGHDARGHGHARRGGGRQKCGPLLQTGDGPGERADIAIVDPHGDVHLPRCAATAALAGHRRRRRRRRLHDKVRDDYFDGGRHFLRHQEVRSHQGGSLVAGASAEVWAPLDILVLLSECLVHGYVGRWIVFGSVDKVTAH
mmetsp:Transcript_52298/g.168439  ORF Transcript_52298/g.168439 Transcript_52298/m.168439 type:complete len:450 (+) Transcript_52298:346-1695(+)